MWEETVISKEEILSLWIPCEDCYRKPVWETGKEVTECMECIALKHREYQAAISFKKGWQAALEARTEGEVK